MPMRKTVIQPQPPIQTPIKLELPNQETPKEENVDGAKTAPSPKEKRKIGMVTTSGNCYKPAMTPRA